MANLNAVIVPAKALKGGRHKIRIAVSHNGETRYVVTDITIDSAKEFKNGSIVKRPDAAILNTKIRGIIQKCQSAVDAIPYIEGMTCAEVVYQIKNGKTSDHRTLESVVNEYVENTQIAKRTKMLYRTLWNRIYKSIPGRTFIENISAANIQLLNKDLHAGGLANSSICTIMSAAKIILDYARKNGYANFSTDPFAGIKKPEHGPRDSWLEVEDIRMIRDLEIKKESTAKARDLFLLSYYLGGINMADMCEINFRENGRRLKYERSKVANKSKLNKYVEFDIPDEAQAIIDKYIGSDGLIEMTDKQREERHRGLIIYQMKKLRELTGLKQLVYYSARKSWSQHAFNLGISESVIDYVLGHSLGKGRSSLFHYIAVTPQMATEAIRKVLDNLK